MLRKIFLFKGQIMEKLAKMAMLGENDVKKLKKDIDGIIRLAEALSEIELDQSLLPDAGTLAEDIIKPSLAREDVLKNAPCISDGYFVVPKTVGE